MLVVVKEANTLVHSIYRNEVSTLEINVGSICSGGSLMHPTLIYVPKKLDKNFFCNIPRINFIFGYGDKFIHILKVDSNGTPTSNLRLR